MYFLELYGSAERGAPARGPPIPSIWNEHELYPQTVESDSCQYADSRVVRGDRSASIASQRRYRKYRQHFRHPQLAVCGAHDVPWMSPRQPAGLSFGRMTWVSPHASSTGISPSRRVSLATRMTRRRWAERRRNATTESERRPVSCGNIVIICARITDILVTQCRHMRNDQHFQSIESCGDA